MFLWAVSDPSRLTQRELQAILDRENEIWISTATVWELAIKSAKHRVEAPIETFDETVREMDLSVLPILPHHAIAAAALPDHHGDPFDRMLIAQARTEGLTLMSRDGAFTRYDVAIFA